MSRYLRLRVLEHIAKTQKPPFHTLHLCDAHSSSFDPYYVRKKRNQSQTFNSHKVRPYLFEKIIFHNFSNTYTNKSNIINFTKFRQHFALVSEVHEMKVINHDHNQVCIQRTTQISLNRNFVKFMHKPQCMRYNKL